MGMTILIIVARDSMVSDLEEFLHKIGIEAYTILRNVMGKGFTGKVYGTFLNPDINAIIFAVLPDAQATVAISALRSIHEQRKEAAHDDYPVHLKVFSFPCNDHV